MSRFDPSTSILAGIDTATLQVSLANAQAAYLALTTGGKVESAQYTQGDGSKSITYTRANLGQLTMVIRQLQAQLGIICAPRRALRVRF